MQLGVKDVAGLLDVSEKTVYRWIEDGKLPGYRISGQYRFNRAELVAWATANRIQVSPNLLLDPDNEEPNLPSLAASLEAGGIHYRVSGNETASALRCLVGLIRLPEQVDREFLLQVLLARERLASTAVGDGIAIPHFRNPIILHLPKPMLTLGFLERPIEYGALDGQPVHTLFAVISPSVKAHLHLMGRLAFALRSPGFVDLIRRQAGRDEILQAVHDLTSHFDPQPVANG